MNCLKKSAQGRIYMADGCKYVVYTRSLKGSMYMIYTHTHIYIYIYIFVNCVPSLVPRYRRHSTCTVGIIFHS